MIIDTPHYYSRSGEVYINKIDALNSKQQIFLNYYDDIWSNCVWDIEPPFSLDYYYRDQAQRIRDEYDYVVLCYSGGFDSTNILETFYYNNIKLDKIVTTGPFSKDSYIGTDENHNGEIYTNVFPYLKELGLESITQVIDYTKLYNTPEKFSIYETGEEWIKNIGVRFSPHHWFWKDLDKYVVPNNLVNKKVAIIFGIDKPHLMYENNTPGFYFRDIPVSDYGNVHGLNKNIDRIKFYWDPAYPNILIKQLHVLYRAYPKNYSDWKYVNNGLPHLQKFNSDRIVYNLKKPLLYKSPKSKTLLIGKRDEFLLKCTDTKILDFYKMGINKFKKEVNEEWFFKPVKSRFYSII